MRAPASQFRWANLLTYVGLIAAAGGAALTTGAAARSWGGAGIAIAFACDLFDGRFARLFRRSEDEEHFGVEIDSLADVISFGVAPPLCLVHVATAATGAERGALLIAALFYVLCIVTRLAHFNVFQAGTGGFIGLPSNMPALACAILLLWEPGALPATVLLAATGAATVSGLRIPRPPAYILYTLLAAALAVASLHGQRLLRG
jgi:CDP-diacylglycerol---serine O-phosphatidyltransferase